MAQWQPASQSKRHWNNYLARREDQRCRQPLMVGQPRLKEFAKEHGRFIRDADDLVRCLTIEFEIELRLWSAIVPVGKRFQLAPPQAPFCQRGASDGDADARRLPEDAGFLCHRFGGGDDAARDETL